MNRQEREQMDMQIDIDESLIREREERIRQIEVGVVLWSTYINISVWGRDRGLLWSDFQYEWQLNLHTHKFLFLKKLENEILHVSLWHLKKMFC